MWRNSSFDIVEIIFSTIKFVFTFWSCIYFISSGVVISQSSFLTLNTRRNLIVYLYYQFHYFVIIRDFNIAKMYFHFLFQFLKFPNLENYWVAHFLLLAVCCNHNDVDD
jgi:hypothetical protein